MNIKCKRNFIITGVLLLLFIVFTITVTLVDVRAIGPEQSSVGLAAINDFMRQLTGVNLFWYDVTEVLGNVALLFAVGFAILGLYQLIRRRSLWKVDRRLLLMGVFYIVIILCYVFFEFFIINYRPVILSTGLEASYPSSHTMMATCIMATAIMEFNALPGLRKALRFTLSGVAAVLMAVIIIGRLFSGIHWFTDILGGLLLSGALVMLYYSAISCVEAGQSAAK